MCKSWNLLEWLATDRSPYSHHVYRRTTLRENAWTVNLLHRLDPPPGSFRTSSDRHPAAPRFVHLFGSTSFQLARLPFYPANHCCLNRVEKIWIFIRNNFWSKYESGKNRNNTIDFFSKKFSHRNITIYFPQTFLEPSIIHFCRIFQLKCSITWFSNCNFNFFEKKPE